MLEYTPEDETIGGGDGGRVFTSKESVMPLQDHQTGGLELANQVQTDIKRRDRRNPGTIIELVSRDFEA